MDNRNGMQEPLASVDRTGTERDTRRIPGSGVGLRRLSSLLLCAGIVLLVIALGPLRHVTGPASVVASEQDPNAPAYYRYKVIRTYPHNTQNFTQGLVYQDGYLYEGTGLYKQSILIKRNLEEDRIVKQLRLPDQYFGEGVTLFGDKVIQLTWKAQVAFVYDKETFRELDQFTYPGQGWGLTTDGKRLILSDGTYWLRFLDPNTYAETGRIRVGDGRRPLRQINELEYIDGQIYANVLPTDYIAIISPETGRVTGWIDLTGLYIPPQYSPSNVVLNGIAYIPETKHLLVTGKCWPKMYEIELVPQTTEP